MSILFEKSSISTLELSNRFIRSATFEGMAADNGAVTSRFIKLMKDLATGGVGLIISGHAYVEKSGQAALGQLGIHVPEKEAYFKNEATIFKKRVPVPLILVGGNRSFEMAEKIVSTGIADHISMSRPLIREPGLINRWKSGDRRKSECLSDNKCFGPAVSGNGVLCVLLDSGLN